MNLATGEHKPYMKENNTPQCIHKDSSHSPSILRNIPESVNKRLSNIASSEPTFNQAAPAYQEALEKSGYKYKLKYRLTACSYSANNKRSRKRHVTWFRPPYNSQATTNIGKKFLTLVDTCFPPAHNLHSLLNRNTVKISNSCMPNMKQIISNHNQSLTSSEQIPTPRTPKTSTHKKHHQNPNTGKLQPSTNDELST